MDKTFTTSAVEGFTGIPIGTIQRYVIDFHDHFSETARQPKKGRRFTEGDVQNLLTIRRLRARRLPDDEIKQILSGAAQAPLEQEYKINDVIELAANALGSAERVEHGLQAMDKTAEELRSLYGYLNTAFSKLKDRVDVLEQNAAPPVAEPSKKKSLLGNWP